MLEFLQKELSIGNIRFVKTKKHGDVVLLIENNQKKLVQWLSIFSEYPPLTTRVQCQLKFFKEYFGKSQRKDVVLSYFKQRNEKYNDRDFFTEKFEKTNLCDLHYFPMWLSGFIEAEGCFTLRKGSSKSPSFSIAQNHDKYLIRSIRDFLKGGNKIGCVNNITYRWEIYRRSVILELLQNFTQWPLLGRKAERWSIF